MKKGFTLLEVILAVFVLTIAVSGAFALISQTFVLASLTQSKLIASYLAQEGIEIVKNSRDTNWLMQRTDSDILWNDGLNEGDWQIDYNGRRLDYGSYGNFLNINSEGFYSYSAIGKQTPFKRKISITNIDEKNIKVVVDVTWKERGRDYHVKVLEMLSNWYEQRYK